MARWRLPRPGGGVPLKDFWRPALALCRPPPPFDSLAVLHLPLGGPSFLPRPGVHRAHHPAPHELRRLVVAPRVGLRNNEHELNNSLLRIEIMLQRVLIWQGS